MRILLLIGSFPLKAIIIWYDASNNVLVVVNFKFYQHMIHVNTLNDVSIVSRSF
jgi:hypothetical protein